MKIPHPIPYQGSKRNLANIIMQYFPNKFTRLVEPFAGSSALTIASSYFFKAEKFYINDINKPLMDLWYEIIFNSESIISKYHKLWHEQIGNEKNYYFKIRDEFNKTKKPEYLFFLLAKCVKAAVRYNSNGNFNQSPDNRRLGRTPEFMREDILNTSLLLANRIEMTSFNYFEIIDSFKPDDVIYLDPPYQGTGISGGFNYLEKIDHKLFVESLEFLNQKELKYILSYDGRTDTKIYGETLPNDLNLVKIEINAGRSSQATLLSRKITTFESIYLSPSLVKSINLYQTDSNFKKNQEKFQSSIFAN